MSIYNPESETKMFQVSTLQALALGYSRQVITVQELLLHGDTGLGTFEDVGGEMILIGGHCYCADEIGHLRKPVLIPAFRFLLCPSWIMHANSHLGPYQILRH